MHRRQFIQNLSLAGAGLALGSLAFPTRSLAASRGANDRIRVGLVGFADRARNTLIPAFEHHAARCNAELVAVSDLWSRRRTEAEDYFQAKYRRKIATYRNNEEMYANAQLDAVIVATADFQHAFHCIEAVGQGCDAYVEKPFAETMADARAALEAVRSSKRIVQIGSQRRSGVNYHAAHDYIRSGKFGDIASVEMTWNVNQPGRWRRPGLVAQLREEDTDWKRFVVGRPFEQWDPRKYLEYRLYWPFSSGIPGQWMCHQIDTIHWFTGLPHPRSVSASGGIYQWKDGRTNFDTLTAVFDYGPLDDKTKGFQAVYSSRFSNSAGGVKEIYYSNGGELNLDTNRVTANGGLELRHARAMGLPANQLEPVDLVGETVAAETDANTGVDTMTAAHMGNWLDCLRSREQPHAPVEAGYQHAIACIMANAAARTGQRVTFDSQRQEVMAGGRVFEL